MTTDTPRITRVVSLPVREVVRESTGTVLDTFRPLWAMSTRLANWAQLQLVTRDVRRTADMDTLPRYSRRQVFGEVPRTCGRRATEKVLADGTVQTTEAKKVGDPQEGSLYRLFCDAYPDRPEWDGATVSARDVLKAIEDDWVGHKTHGRYAVLWQGRAAAATFRFPYPWLIPADKGRTLRLMRAEYDRLFVSIPMPGEEDDRALLRLADGSQFRRQLRRFDWLLDGHLDRLRQAKVTGRKSGGRLVGADLRIVASFDRQAAAVEGTTATVRTGPESLWTATTGDDEPLVVNFDHLRSLQVSHDRWAYRVRQDGALRDESDRKRAGGSMVRARLDRAKHRVRTECQQAAERMVRALRRRGVSDVVYDDSDRSFMSRADGRSGLNWTAVRAALTCKCEEYGISLEHLAGGDDDAE